MPNIVIKPARSGGTPIVELTGSSIDGISKLEVGSGGSMNFTLEKTGESYSFSGGPAIFNGGLSGSLTKLSNGNDYLLPGDGITLSTGSGQITITSTITQVNPGGSTTEVQFKDGSTFGGDSTFTFNKNTDTLNVSNVIVSGDLTINGLMTTVNTTNLEVKDSVVGLGFASGTIAQPAGDRGLIGGLAGDSNVALLWKNSDSEFVMGRTTSSATGSFGIDSLSNLRLSNLQANIVTASLGFSGSLTKLSDGTSYLRGSDNIIVSSASNGAVTISATGLAPSNASYLTLGDSTGLSNERVFTPGTGIKGSDIGTPYPYTVSIDDSVVATISGSTFSGAVKFNGGLSGSLQTLANGQPYLLAGAGISISTSSMSPVGQITIASTITQATPGSPSNSVQFNNAGTFGGDSQFRFTPGAPGFDALTLVGNFTQGFVVSATGEYSHAEGYSTTASGNGSHAEGYTTVATAWYAHAEGQLTLASAQGAHTEGYLTTGSADSAHAEGHGTQAVAAYSHTAGIFTIASGSGQNVVGKYNKRGNADSLFVIGNGDGDSNSNRSDIFLVNSGSVLVGSASLDSDTFFYVGTKGSATNARFDGNMVISGTLDVKNGAANSVLSVNGSKVGVGTSTPSYALEVNGDFAATTKSFVIDHPDKPGWKLRHGSLEGPENGVYVRGRTTASEIILPSYWANLVDENSITVHITPIRSKLTYFVSSIDVSKVCVEFDTQDVEYCYLIQASRKDETFEVEFESN